MERDKFDRPSSESHGWELSFSGLLKPIRQYASTSQVGRNGALGLFPSWTFLSSIPAEHLHIALYVTELCHSALGKGLGPSSLEAAVCSIRWGHQLDGIKACTTDHTVVKSCVEGAKRRLGRPVQPKQPLTLELVVKLCEQYRSSSVLAHVRFLYPTGVIRRVSSCRRSAKVKDSWRFSFSRSYVCLHPETQKWPISQWSYVFVGQIVQDYVPCKYYRKDDAVIARIQFFLSPGETYHKE